MVNLSTTTSPKIPMVVAPLWTDQLSVTLTSDIHDNINMDTDIIDRINWIAYVIVAGIIVALGFIGNILNLVVLTRPRLKGVMYAYLLGLAISNLCVLVSSVPSLIDISWRSQSTPYYTWAFYNAHLGIPLLNMFMASSVYIIISMTINRYLSIYRPIQFVHIHTYTNALRSIAFSFLGGIILHIPLCFEKYVVYIGTCQEGTNMDDDLQICQWTSKVNEAVAQHKVYRAYLWLSETCLRIGPIILLAVLNILIIIKFQKIAQKRQDRRRNVNTNQNLENDISGEAPSYMTTNTRHILVSNRGAKSSVQQNRFLDKNKSRDEQSTIGKQNLLHTRSTNASTRRKDHHSPEERMLVIVLIAIVVLFVVCTTPAAFLSIFYSETLINSFHFAIFRACANNLELLNFALNFYIYCMCSGDIRREFVSVLKSFFKPILFFCHQTKHEENASETHNCGQEMITIRSQVNKV